MDPCKPTNPISTLNNYTIKNGLPLPEYFINQEEKGFCCEIVLLEMKERATGRSKVNAKHNSALKMLKNLKIGKSGDADYPLTLADAVYELRNYCVQNRLPLPIFEVIASGDKTCTHCVATCSVASVKKVASSFKKIEAKQNVADIMLKAIKEESAVGAESQNEQSMEKNQRKQQEGPMPTEERYHRYTMYHKDIEQGPDRYEPVPLADRHNYFTKFHEQLKNAAFHVMASKYDDVKQQAYDVLKALKLEFTEKEEPSSTSEPMVIIDVECEIDVLFIGTKHTVYKKVVEYFSEMLD